MYHALGLEQYVLVVLLELGCQLVLFLALLLGEKLKISKFLHTSKYFLFGLKV